MIEVSQRGAASIDLILATTGDQVADRVRSVVQRVSEEVVRQVASGIPPELVLDAVIGELELGSQSRLVGTPLRELDQVLRSGYGQATGVGLIDGYEQAGGLSVLMGWTLTSATGTSCEDCERQAGKVRPLGEWYDLNIIPRTQWTATTPKCCAFSVINGRCVFTPKSAQPPVVRDHMRI